MRYDFTDLAPGLPSFLSADASSSMWKVRPDIRTRKWYPSQSHPEDFKWMPRQERKSPNFYKGFYQPRLEKGKTPYHIRSRVNQTQYPTNISYFRFSRSWIQSSDCLNFRDPYTLQYTNLTRLILFEPGSLEVSQLSLIFQDYSFPSFRYFLFKSILFKPFLHYEEQNALLLTGFSSRLQSTGFFTSFRLSRLLFPLLRLSKHYSFTLSKEFHNKKQKNLLLDNLYSHYHDNNVSLLRFNKKIRKRNNDPLESLLRDYFVRYSQIANDAMGFRQSFLFNRYAILDEYSKDLEDRYQSDAVLLPPQYEYEEDRFSFLSYELALQTEFLSFQICETEKNSPLFEYTYFIDGLDFNLESDISRTEYTVALISLILIFIAFPYFFFALLLPVFVIAFPLFIPQLLNDEDDFPLDISVFKTQLNGLYYSTFISDFDEEKEFYIPFLFDGSLISEFLELKEMFEEDLYVSSAEVSESTDELNDVDDLNEDLDEDEIIADFEEFEYNIPVSIYQQQQEFEEIQLQNNAVPRNAPKFIQVGAIMDQDDFDNEEDFLFSYELFYLRAENFSGSFIDEGDSEGYIEEFFDLGYPVEGIGSYLLCDFDLSLAGNYNISPAISLPLTGRKPQWPLWILMLSQVFLMWGYVYETGEPEDDTGEMFGSGDVDNVDEEDQEDSDDFIFDEEDDDLDEDDEIFEEGFEDYEEEPFVYNAEFPSHMSIPFFTILNEISIFLIFLFTQIKNPWRFISFIFLKF